MALTFLARGKKIIPPMSLLHKLIWAYFLLLIFEGALRKWVVPQFSGPLLLVRDPIAMLILWEAYRTRKWPEQWSQVIGILAGGMIALCFVQMIAGENPWFIALYGLRSFLLPFPVAFVIGDNLSEEDLHRFGRVTLWLLLPLTLLEVAQYYAPAFSPLNAGAGEGVTQLSYASGHVRASATFSYVSGPTHFLPLAGAFIFYGIVKGSFAPKWLLLAASCAIIVAVPVTGSRMMLLLLLMLLCAVGVAAMLGVSRLASSLKIGLALLVVSLAVSRLPVFSEATSTFEQRLVAASGSEGGAQGTLQSRITLPFAQAIDLGVDLDHWYGRGLGVGSNVAATLLTGTQGFLAGEGEVTRMIVEFGPLCGTVFLLFRFLLAVLIAARALALAREDRPLAWFLFPLLFYALVFGTLEVPTIQGFMVVALGFSLAALKVGQEAPAAAPAVNPASGPPLARKFSAARARRLT